MYLPVSGYSTIVGNTFISTMLPYYPFSVFSHSTCKKVFIIKPIYVISIFINHIVSMYVQSCIVN